MIFGSWRKPSWRARRIAAGSDGRLEVRDLQYAVTSSDGARHGPSNDGKPATLRIVDVRFFLDDNLATTAIVRDDRGEFLVTQGHEQTLGEHDGAHVRPRIRDECIRHGEARQRWEIHGIGDALHVMTAERAGTPSATWSRWTSMGPIAPPAPAPAPPAPTPADSDRDGVPDTADTCSALSGPPARSGCPSGLLADPSIRYRAAKKSIRVIAYYVKATKGARVVVTCSRGCRRSSGSSGSTGSPGGIAGTGSRASGSCSRTSSSRSGAMPSWTG